MIIYPKSVIDKMVYDLIMQLRISQQKFSSVVGIANGGLYISKRVALYLSLHHFTVRISYYDGFHKNRKVPIINCPSIGDNCIVVDDLVDSGRTFETFRTVYGNNHKFAALFANPCIQPDFYVKHKPKEWIVFPWE